MIAMPKARPEVRNIKIYLAIVTGEVEMAGEPTNNGSTKVFVDTFNGFWTNRSASVYFDSYTAARFYAESLRPDCIWDANI